MGEVKEKTKPSFQPPPRWVLTIAVISSMILLGVGFYQVRKMQEPQTTPKVIPTIPPIKYVSALGRLEPEGEVIKISTSGSLQGSSKVEKLLVKEGDQIEKGKIIAILDNEERLKAAVEKAKQQVNVAQINLAKVRGGAKQGEIFAQQAEINKLTLQRQRDLDSQKAEIARIKAQKERDLQLAQANINSMAANLENAKVECDRYEELLQAEAVSKSLRDSKCLSYKTSIENLKQAETNLQRIEETSTEQIKSALALLNRIRDGGREQINSAIATLDKIAEVRPVDIQSAQAEVNSAIANLKQVEADLDLAYIKAPFTGQVLKVYTKPGEVISANGIIELGKTAQMYAVAEVYETDIGKVNQGQPVIITSKGFDWKLAGTVDQKGLKIAKKDVLNTDPAADVDARIVEVKIKIAPEDSEKVKSLTNLKVEIRIDI